MTQFDWPAIAGIAGPLHRLAAKLVYPAFALAKRRNRRALDASEQRQRTVVEQSITRSSATPVLRWTMALEERLGSRVRYPVGIRCVVTAVKP